MFDISSEQVRLSEQTIPIAAHVDVLICGGGVAGTAAAVAAARNGAKTLLIERAGFLGGTATGSAMGLIVIPASELVGFPREFFSRLARPYKGDAPAVTAVLANQVPMMFPTLPVALPYIKSGKLRAIAVSSAKQSALLPEVPTVAESGGLPEFAVSIWVGVVAPPGTPKEIVDKLNAEIRKTIAIPDIREHLAALGTDPASDTPEQFSAYIAAETEQWLKVARAAKIKPN